jgi:hypothetical protein
LVFASLAGSSTQPNIALTKSTIAAKRNETMTPPKADPMTLPQKLQSVSILSRSISKHP